MYRHLESLIVLKGLSKKYIAEQLGIRYPTLLMKLKGSSYFTLDEAYALKEILDAKNMSIEDLFTKSVAG